jgi:hypothetical protein
MHSSFTHSFIPRREWSVEIIVFLFFFAEITVRLVSLRLSDFKDAVNIETFISDLSMMCAGNF